jgi:HD-like signal output (HDOD) protein
MISASHIAATLEMPASPWAIQSEINRALQDACSPVNRFAEIIESDTGLACRVLALANSPYYAHSEEVGTVPEAIMLLGLQKIRDLVTVILAIEFFSSIPSNIVSMESFARHGLGVALACRLLATARRDSRAEQHFLAGLIHDVGRLALLQKCPDAMREALISHQRDPGGASLYALEQKLLGCDHAQVGAELLRLWRFPPAVRAAIRWQHEPARAGEYETEASLLHVADVISLSLGQGSSGEALPPTLQKKAWNRLRLPERVLDMVLPELHRQYHELAQVFHGAEHPLATA